MEKASENLTNQESREEDFFSLSFKLEKQWKESLHKPTSKELVAFFKPTRKILQLKIKEWEAKCDEAKDEIRKVFKVFKEKSPKDMYFAEAYAEAFLFPEYQKAQRQIFRLRAQLSMLQKKKVSIVNYEEQLEIARNYPIELLARNRLELRTSGKNLITTCIFHNDTRPSMLIYTDTNHYHCYSCGAHGNSINFLMALEGITFKEALTALQTR